MQAEHVHTVGTVDLLSASARSLLQVLSVLDADRIPEELLQVADGGKEVNLKLPNYPIKKDEYCKARAELINTSLVTENTAANELRIHRLVQDVVRQSMEESELCATYAAAALLISAVWPYVSGTDPTRNRFWRIPKAEKYTAHICRLHALFAEEKYVGTATSGYVFCSYAWYMCERGHPDQTEIFASLAQRSLRKALDAGDDDEERITHWLAEAHHNLSLAAVKTGSSDGIHDAKLWIDLLLDRSRRRRPSKAEALSLATAYNQMGICHMRRDEVEDAMNSWTQSLTTYRNIENAPDFSGTFPAISLAIQHALQGQPNEGEEVLRPTLDEHERILGKDDTTTAESGHIWGTMGNIRIAQERYEEGLEYHERAVRNMKVTLGEKHSFTEDCFYSVGVDWIRQGDTEKARENLDAAIEAFTSATHRDAQAARAMWKMGCLLKTAGDRSESDILFQKAMKIRHKLMPDDDRPVEELHDKDWADLIYFWSR